MSITYAHRGGLPQLEIGGDPVDIAHWATQVEQLGYEYILVYDHVLGAGTSTRTGWRGYTSDDCFHEVFVLLGYFAALTSAVELTTGVLILPQRQTVLVAKQAAQVDVLSAGRMRFGIGVGWNPVEYQGLGEAFGNRGARSEEQIELMRALWSAPTITFHGRWHQVDEAGINPRPVRGNIPIWIGGTAEPVLRRVGRLGDGWLPLRRPDDKAAAMIDRIRGYAEEVGSAPDGDRYRSPAHYRRSAPRQLARLRGRLAAARSNSPVRKHDGHAIRTRRRTPGCPRRRHLLTSEPSHSDVVRHWQDLSRATYRRGRTARPIGASTPHRGRA